MLRDSCCVAQRPALSTQQDLRAACGAGIITEKGVIPKTGDTFDIPSFFKSHGLPVPDASATAALKPLDEASVVEYVAAHAELARHVDAAGGSAARGTWKCQEIGDGNINFVFVVSGASGAVIVKQGLPYIRCVGESWPLSQVHPIPPPVHACMHTAALARRSCLRRTFVPVSACLTRSACMSWPLICSAEVNPLEQVHM